MKAHLSSDCKQYFHRLSGKNAGVSLGTKGKSASASIPGAGLGIVNQTRRGCFGSLVWMAVIAGGLIFASSHFPLV